MHNTCSNTCGVNNTLIARIKECMQTNYILTTDINWINEMVVKASFNEHTRHTPSINGRGSSQGTHNLRQSIQVRIYSNYMYMHMSQCACMYCLTFAIFSPLKYSSTACVFRGVCMVGLQSYYHQIKRKDLIIEILTTVKPLHNRHHWDQ